jgi:hypothetical protein
MNKPNRIQRFFLLCSGADKEIIYQCSTEWNKYSGIGATIFFTGLLASLSGGYALYTIFRGAPNALTYAMLFGILWGFVIFNLDRFIVSSIKKEGKFRKELLYSSPRIVLAIIISVVIAKPLEVRIFESRIEQQILEDKRQKLADEKLSIDKLNDITALDNTLTKKSSDLHKLDSLRQGDPTTEGFRSLLRDRDVVSKDANDIAETNNKLIADYNGKIALVRNNPASYIKNDSATNSKPKLVQQAAREINDLAYSRNQLNKAINTANQRVRDLDTEIQKQREDYRAEMKKKIKDGEAEQQEIAERKSKADSIGREQFDESVAVKEKSYSNNFITQLEALSNLTSSQSTMRWTSWLIMLLFIVIEISPVLVKLLSAKGPYDDTLSIAEQTKALEESKKLDELKIQIDALMDSARQAAQIAGTTYIATKEDELKIQLEQNKEILAKVAARQQELADKYIDAWYEEEKAKIKVNTHQMSQQASAELEEVFWRLTGSPDKIEYFFRNGSSKDNELIYSENKIFNIGKWAYHKTPDEIMIELNNHTLIYTIAELKTNSLKLREKGTPEILEFERA